MRLWIEVRYPRYRREGTLEAALLHHLSGLASVSSVLTIALYASLLLLKETLDGSSTELETQTTPKIPLTRVNPRETTKKTLR